MFLHLASTLVALTITNAAQAATIDDLQAREPEVVVEVVYVPQYTVEYVDRVEYVETPQTVECGCCGAHVTQWWTIRNDADTAWVDVCELCYLRIAAEDYYWPTDPEKIIEDIEGREQA